MDAVRIHSTRLEFIWQALQLISFRIFSANQQNENKHRLTDRLIMLPQGKDS